MRHALLILGLGACGQASPDPTPGPSNAAVRQAPPAPVPGPNQPRLDWLTPPFEGSHVATNPFDHRAGPHPGIGDVWDWRGQTMLGSRGHRAWDWALPIGTPVRAPADGLVVSAGAVPPFRCKELGREVSDQLAVVVRHADGDTTFETSFDHLSSVDVAVGDTVSRGQMLGRSGNSGCSTGAHLHFGVFVVVDDTRIPVDPYGWRGDGLDPWASRVGQPPRWLWKQAPPTWFERRAVPDAGAGPVVVRAVRYATMHDEAEPNGERIELVIDPLARHDGPVDLSGYRVDWGSGAGFSVRKGTVLRRGQVVQLFMGQGKSTETTWFAEAREAMLPDAGGVVTVRSPDGAVVHALSYGLAEAPDLGPAEEPVYCTTPSDHPCVPLGVPGAARALAMSADGAQLAAVVGRSGQLVWLGADGAAHAVDRRDGGTAGLVDVVDPVWVRPDWLLFNAPTADDAYTVASMVPGMVASTAFRADGPLRYRLLDARRDTLLLRAVRKGAVGLAVFRPGDAVPSRLSKRNLDVSQARLSPDGESLLFVDRQRLMRAAVDGLEDASRLYPRDPAAFGWMASGPVALAEGAVVRAGEVSGQAWLTGALGDLMVLSHDGARGVVVRESGLTVFDDTGTVLRELPAAGVTAIAVAHGPSGTHLAWFEVDGVDGRSGLFREAWGDEAVTRGP